MAPLPLFHRPLSQDNSRETSLSSGRGGGRSTGPDTSGSGSGVSLPMRSGLSNNCNFATPTTPDTPSTTLTTTLPTANSSDYLMAIPNPKKSKHYQHHHRKSIGSIGRQASRASHTTGTPVSSPSDDPGSNSDTEEATLLHSASRSNFKTMIYNDEAETSFTVVPPAPPRKLSSSGSTPAGAAYSNVIPSKAYKKGSSRLPSVIPPSHLDLPSPIITDSGGTTPLAYAPPPPPPKGYTDSHNTSSFDSPVLPPLPPLPAGEVDEDQEGEAASGLRAAGHPLMSPLDVSSLRSRATAVPAYVMDSPRDVIGSSNRKETLYTITSGGNNNTTTNTIVASSESSANETAPPTSEISV